jgi:hypothetical protein
MAYVVAASLNVDGSSWSHPNKKQSLPHSHSFFTRKPRPDLNDQEPFSASGAHRRKLIAFLCATSLVYFFIYFFCLVCYEQRLLVL